MEHHSRLPCCARKLILHIIEYLLEHEEFNPNQRSSRWGCNLNLACIKADLRVIKELLQLKAAVEVEDHKGRPPMHFALYRTIEHMELISKGYRKGVDPLATKDHMERNASTSLSLVVDWMLQYVLDRYGEFVNKCDIDGWTSLLWAIRDCGFWYTETNQKSLIIEDLKCGANQLVIGKGWNRAWTLRSLARHYGMGDEMDESLTPGATDINSSADKEAHGMFLGEGEQILKKGHIAENAFCDVCLMEGAPSPALVTS